MHIIVCSSFHPFHHNVTCGHMYSIIHTPCFWPPWYLAFLLLSTLRAPSLSFSAWLFRLYELHPVVGISPIAYKALTTLLWPTPIFSIAHKSSSPEHFMDTLNLIWPNPNWWFSYFPYSVIHKLLLLLHFLLDYKFNNLCRQSNWALECHSRFLYHPEFSIFNQSWSHPNIFHG